MLGVYVCMYECMYVCMYVCMFVCMYELNERRDTFCFKSDEVEKERER